jgi:hypothetical protein
MREGAEQPKNVEKPEDDVIEHGFDGALHGDETIH